MISQNRSTLRNEKTYFRESSASALSSSSFPAFFSLAFAFFSAFFSFFTGGVAADGVFRADFGVSGGGAAPNTSGMAVFFFFFFYWSIPLS